MGQAKGDGGKPNSRGVSLFVLAAVVEEFVGTGSFNAFAIPLSEHKPPKRRVIDMETRMAATLNTLSVIYGVDLKKRKCLQSVGKLRNE